MDNFRFGGKIYSVNYTIFHIVTSWLNPWFNHELAMVLSWFGHGFPVRGATMVWPWQGFLCCHGDMFLLGING